MLRDRAVGIDPRALELDAEPISISHEETFDRDVADRAVLEEELRRMAERVARRLEAARTAGRTVTTKVRYPDFSIRSRSRTLPAPTDDARLIGQVACAVRARAPRPARARSASSGWASRTSGSEHQLALVEDEPPATEA